MLLNLTEGEAGVLLYLVQKRLHEESLTNYTIRERLRNMEIKLRRLLDD